MSVFIAEYLRDFDGTRAAIRAGYSRRDAKQRAYRLLHHPAVAPELARRMQSSPHGLNVITADEAVVRLSDLARDPQVPVEQRVRILLFFLQRLEPRTGRSPARALAMASPQRCISCIMPVDTNVFPVVSGRICSR